MNKIARFIHFFVLTAVVFELPITQVSAVPCRTDPALKLSDGNTATVTNSKPKSWIFEVLSRAHLAPTPS